jgi:hypothetical protein
MISASSIPFCGHPKDDAIIDGTEKQFKDMEDKIPVETKSKLEEKIEAVKDGDDTQAINDAIEELEEVAHAMAEELYKTLVQKPLTEQAHLHHRPRAKPPTALKKTSLTLTSKSKAERQQAAKSEF